MIKYQQISYTIEEGDFLYYESDGMICRVQIDKEHLIEKKPIIDRSVIISYLAVTQEDDGELCLFDLDKMTFKKSRLFADEELLKKKIMRRQLDAFDSQFDRFQIEDFFENKVLKKFTMNEKKEMLKCLQSYQKRLMSVLAYVVDKSGEKIHYNSYLADRQDAVHIKYDNLLETIDFK